MIETAHLQLIPAELSHFEAILTDESRLAARLQVRLAEDWLGFPEARSSIQPSYDYLKAHPSALGWWTYLFVHRADRALIGMGGYKGEADEEGTVEIGYTVAPAYRGRGLATEAALGLIEHAFSHPHVRRVDAHTLPATSASTRILEKAGMTFMGMVDDPEDGEVWRWSLQRDTNPSQETV